MSKILDLAKDFNEQSKKQANYIDQQLKQDFKKHEERIQAALNESEQRIKSDIDDHRETIYQSVKWLWIMPAIPLLLSSLIAAAILTYQGAQIIERQGQIMLQDQTLNENSEIIFKQEKTIRHYSKEIEQYEKDYPWLKQD